MTQAYKTVEVRDMRHPKTLELRINGKLTVTDYEYFVPQIESRIREQGNIRQLITLVDFHGWTAGALWEDVKFDARHFNDIERVAIVGDRKWEKGMTVFYKPFTRAKVRYFDKQEMEKAVQWIRE